MELGDEVLVEIDGKMHNGVLIGIGDDEGSRVYIVGNRTVYYVKDNCSRRTIAFFGRKYDHLPKFVKHNDVRVGRRQYAVYSSPIYRSVSEKDSVKVIADEFIEKFEDFMIAFPIATAGDEFNGVETMEVFIGVLLEIRKIVPNSIINTLKFLVSVAKKCGQDILVDFELDNFGVGEDGKLVFRDVFWLFKQSK